MVRRTSACLANRCEWNGDGPDSTRHKPQIRWILLASSCVQQYLDFFGREPDPGGFEYWLDLIVSCAADQACIHTRRLRVSDAFFVESEWQLTGAFLHRLYQASYGRYPTFTDYLSDRSQLAAGSANTFVDGFVARPAFTSTYPDAMTPEEYIEALDANSGRVLTQAQKAELISALTSGSETRASVLRRVVESATFTEHEYNSIFVTSLYLHYLRREPEPGGFAFWLSKINNFPPRSLEGQLALVCSFITSREYQERFSSVVTRSNQQCRQ